MSVAIDLFSGAGGATQGLVDAGFRVVAAVEFDHIAAESYRANHPEVRVWQEDIRKIPATVMMRQLGMKPGDLDLLKACPPCQGFSTLAGNTSRGLDDPRNELVNHTVRFVRAFRPRGVLIENVPGLGRDGRSRALSSSLIDLGYKVNTYLVDAVDFGVPQRRKRFIMLAVRGLRAELPVALGLQGAAPIATVREAFTALESEVAHGDPLHRPATVSEVVQRRIDAIPIGGNRFDLPVELQLACHSRLGDRRVATGSYGRMKWDQPAPTMTTRCTTPACGAFIHPRNNRPITLREAAALQTFPAGYHFAGTRGQIERQIGNAVPVLMAKSLGLVMRSLTESGRDES